MSRRVGRGRKRWQARGRGGRFKRNTLANTFGFHAPVCPHCRSFNTHAVGEPPPETCHACGKPMKEPETEGDP